MEELEANYRQNQLRLLENSERPKQDLYGARLVVFQREPIQRSPPELHAILRSQEAAKLQLGGKDRHWRLIHPKILGHGEVCLKRVRGNRTRVLVGGKVTGFAIDLVAVGTQFDCNFLVDVSTPITVEDVFSHLIHHPQYRPVCRSKSLVEFIACALWARL